MVLTGSRDIDGGLTTVNAVYKDLLLHEPPIVEADV